ncbi:MAG: hypothetical protein HKM05_10560 [Spirochaetales bacterium]|nr:hypothetical protein [Spirochaetales bacterium]
MAFSSRLLPRLIASLGLSWTVLGTAWAAPPPGPTLPPGPEWSWHLTNQDSQDWLVSPQSAVPGGQTLTTLTLEGHQTLWHWQGSLLVGAGQDSQGFFSPNPWVFADLTALFISYSQPLNLWGKATFTATGGRIPVQIPHLFDQPLDGVGLSYAQDNWVFHLNAGWNGWLSKRVSRMDLSAADQADRLNPSVWFASPRAVFSAWEDFHSAPESGVSLGLLWEQDFRTSWPGINLAGDLLTDGTGDYSAKYAWANWQNTAIIPFEVYGVWELGTTVLYNLNDARYEYYPVQAWSGGGAIGPSYHHGVRLRLVFQASSGDGAERQGFAEGSATADNVTHLYQPPDQQLYSPAFAADAGNLQWYGLKLDILGRQLARIPLNATFEWRAIWRSQFGPVGYPLNNVGNLNATDLFLGWSWDHTVTWTGFSGWTLAWNLSLAVPNSSPSGYWLGAPTWQIDTGLSAQWYY